MNKCEEVLERALRGKADVPWQTEYRGIRIFRRKRDATEFYCTIGAHNAHKEFVCENVGGLRAAIDVEMARRQP